MHEEARTPEMCPSDALLRVLHDSYHIYNLDDLPQEDLAVLLRRRGVEAVAVTFEDVDQEDQDGAEHAGDLQAHRLRGEGKG